MKKLLVSLGLVFVVLGFSACSIKGEFQDGPSLVSMSGTLVEQTSRDKELGTHFLIDDAGKKTAARSLTINLSGDEYLNNKVKATGVLNTTDNVFEITGISVDQILSKNTKQNKQVEYKDTDAGFRLTYFDDWTIKTAKDKSVTFTAPLATGSKVAAVVTVAQKPFAYEPKTKADGSLDSALEAYYGQVNKDKKFDKTLLSKIGTDQMDAIKAVANGKTTYTLYRSGLIYDLSFAPADPVKAEDELTFNKMLADFQFVSMDSSESAVVPDSQAVVPAAGTDLPKIDMEMTTFESLPYQFSGQYPTKWYYAGVKSTTDASILHHYGFSDEVSNTKEIISLDVLAGAIPAGGTKLTFAGKNLDIFEENGNYIVYLTLKSRNFRFRGPASYKDLILFMAANIETVEKPLQQ